ncbi:MAG: 1-deoxy-D-xylulose-5-phosphate synthase, partial [Planctomycetota bacterium]|nr:1-deoxy-D-xylulose-5-phosphate synthase [Planctomycetota bacterium]
MSDHAAVPHTSVPSAGGFLKPLGDVVHKAGAAVGAERPVVECPVARPFLAHITSPDDLRKIPAVYLGELAAEIREKIDETVQHTGGHLSSNLGVTELTIALHRVFDFSKDRLVFDVGHQVYPHKLLTGRYAQFHTLRQKGGISGYPNPHESPYDLFMTGHAGCAVSSTLGLAIGDHMQGKQGHFVAVVGDGAMTSGLVFEAMNHAGAAKEDILVVLNDNGCAISPTTGALSATCSDIRAMHFFKQLRGKGKDLLEKIPFVGKDVERLAEQALDAISRATHAPGAIFLDLGFRYFGPVDGHDIDVLVRWMTEMKSLKGPKLLHVVTRKGYGLPWAAEDPTKWHGARPYEVEDEEARFIKPVPAPPSYTKVISDTLIELARTDEKLVAITAAMPEGTGLVEFQKVFPKRYFDVGICEQHAVCFAAALAKSGLHPVACIYSSFLQRAMDQLMHEISLQDGLPVLLCIDRAGLVGDDGPTHHGVLDLAYIRPLPFFVLMAPKDRPEAEAMVKWALSSGKPVALRYPRDNVPTFPLSSSVYQREEVSASDEGEVLCQPIELGKGEIVLRGSKVAVLAYGSEVVHAMEAAMLLKQRHGLNITVANARFCKPFDADLLAGL